MIYYNDLAFEESNFDIIDDMLCSPIYEEFVNYESIVSESIVLSEAQEVKLQVLREFSIKDIGKRILGVLKIIKDFFIGIAKKIGGFFKKIFSKKTVEKADKIVQDAAKENPALKTPVTILALPDKGGNGGSSSSSSTGGNGGSSSSSSTDEFPKEKEKEKILFPVAGVINFTIKKFPLSLLNPKTFTKNTINTNMLKKYEGLFKEIKDEILAGGRGVNSQGKPYKDGEMDADLKSELKSPTTRSEIKKAARGIYGGGSIKQDFVGIVGFTPNTNITSHINERIEKSYYKRNTDKISYLEFSHWQVSSANDTYSEWGNMESFFKALVNVITKMENMVSFAINKEADPKAFAMINHMTIQPMKITKQGVSQVSKILVDAAKQKLAAAITLAKKVSKGSAERDSLDSEYKNVKSSVKSMSTLESYDPWAGLE